MMGGLFIWLILGVVLYLMLSRRGGMMGCCGGHNHHPQERTQDRRPHEDRSAGSQENIIDLKKEDYHVTTR